MNGRLIRRILIGAVLLLSAGTGLVVCLLSTTAGSSWVVKLALARSVKAEQITIGRIHGTLLRGMVFEGVVARGLGALPSGNMLLIDRLEASYVWRQPWRSPLKGRYARLALPGIAERISVGKFEGHQPDGVRLDDVEVAGIRLLPKDTVIAIQRLELAGTHSMQPGTGVGRIAIRNGRLGLPHAEPMLFYGALSDEDIDVHAYARTLTPQELQPFFPSSTLLQVVSGTVRDAQAHLIGPWRQPALSGTFQVEQLTRAGFSLQRAPGTFTGSLAGLGGDLALSGTLLLTGGSLSNKNLVITLQASRLLITGDLKNPTYDVKGSSTVNDTSIRLLITGTRVKPKITLSSSPPLPQERLLLMLATGRSLAGTETSLGQGEVSSDLAADFIDYFVFGGEGSRLAQRIGITGLSVTYAPETNTVGLKTTLADKVAITYEAEQPRPEHLPGDTGAAAPVTPPADYKVGAEYKMTGTTSLKVEGEREFLRPKSGTGGTGTLGQPGPVPQTREELLLKVEKKF